MVREQLSENLSSKRTIFNVIVAQHSNMGFLGNIFIREKRIPFFVGVAYIQKVET